MSDPIVEVRQGKIKGTIVKNVDGGQYISFHGIPYAQPPIGNLRFKDPRPPQAWSGVREVGKDVPKAAQFNLTNRHVSGTEDCLYMNVAINSLGGKRPVIVWIHGGGFHMGSPSSEFSGPDYLLKYDIVFVGITYRLGCFGFLNLDLPDASGNQALKDQVAGLRWVQENISVFGGDPENVTIYGQSAGAVCVHLLTLSPLAKGLFHKVILQSSVAINPWAINLDHVKTGLKLAEEAKKKTDDPAEALKHLMTLSTEQLIQAQEGIEDPNKPFELNFTFTPCIDAKSKEPFMPKSPVEMIMNRGIDLPLIIGFTSDEGIITTLGPKGPLIREINVNFASHLADDLRIRDTDRLANVAEAVRNRYFGKYLVSITEHKNDYAQLKSDVMFVNGIQRLIDVQLGKKTPTYTYKFSYRPNYPTVRKVFEFEIEGACHCDELGAIFHSNLMMPHQALQKGTTDRLVMERMTRMWTNFAKTGNPTPEIDELIPCKWEPITKEKKNYLEINEQLTPGVNPNEASWKFWSPILESLQWRVCDNRRDDDI